MNTGGKERISQRIRCAFTTMVSILLASCGSERVSNLENVPLAAATTDPVSTESLVGVHVDARSQTRADGSF